MVGLPQPTSLSPESFASGQFSEAVAIEVPEFRGLEPLISLAYRSSTVLQYSGDGGGWLGVGWYLRGIPVIERAVRGGGTPAFDANDVYLLAGDEMVACVAGMVSPSCASGGTHATRIESYRKIAFTANTWSVWAKDGTRYEFRPVGETLPPPGGSSSTTLALANDYRWLLRTVTDTHGNLVTYSYVCEEIVDCRIDTIAYGGASVKFHWEARPDTFTYATGKNVALITQGNRLKTVDVKFAGNRVRAYTLAYQTSPATSRSLLTSVQQFPSDATVAGDGTVTAGATPPLPAIALGYQTDLPTVGTPTLYYSKAKWNPFAIIGDFDGDGLKDRAVRRQRL